MTKSSQCNNNNDETDNTSTSTNQAAASSSSQEKAVTFDETAAKPQKRRPYVPEEPVDSLFVGGSTKVHMGKMEPCRDLGTIVLF